MFVFPRDFCASRGESRQNFAPSTVTGTSRFLHGKKKQSGIVLRALRFWNVHVTLLNWKGGCARITRAMSLFGTSKYKSYGLYSLRFKGGAGFCS